MLLTLVFRKLCASACKFLSVSLVCLLVQVTTEGVVEAFCGSEEAGSDDDESSSAATFREPRGVSVDGACNVLVADSKNHKVGLGFRV